MDDAKMHKLNGVIEHYKRHIGRATESNDNDKIMNCITKLSRLPITVQNLQNTGIGRVVNNLRKYDGNIGESAKTLVIQWKNVVKIEETENFYRTDDNSDEEHDDDVSSPKDNEEFIDEPEITNKSNDDSSDHESSHHKHHEKSKHKKSKKDKGSKKRKESYSTSTDDQGDGHVLKKVKKDYKYENVKVKTEIEKCKIAQNVATTSHKENNNSYEESTKKEKKSSHSDKKKDKHKSSHKSESKSHSHKEKNESKSSGHKDKSDSKKNIKDKVKEESKPSTSTNFTSSSKTFEEALLGIPVKKKQIKSKHRDRSRSSEREFSSAPPSPLAPFNLDPEELIANYKPLSQLDVKKKKMPEDLDPLAKIMTTKNMRTKVYSGNKSTIYTEVPRLLDFCIQTIKDNLDALEYTGGVPFSILEPILKHASPDQLYNLEQYNYYLIEDTGVLWEYHCKKEFRNKVPDKNEPWRNFYIRCLEERETKLAKLRQNINANQAASTPVRKTQLAYVDSAVKPPRGVAKKQAKFQTASSDIKRNILNKSMMGGHSTAEALSASKRSTTMATGVPIALTSPHTSSSAMKKKKAPLMQKALQLIKSSRRR
ncbi:transcription elongation factor B polypeptide 3-like [Metopolophium dirhodum]|uniref:transcription elongation factor B polypeptide 3-like n=1 Tax=Metopolophium dirhodum TaxID=44670 RepID=UPI00298F6A3D|nr:transcription elongation factor B polypeptide 3-like [Metopolophium dirhodum]